jgi:hypothetical protein
MSEENDEELQMTFSIPVETITDQKYIPWIVGEIALHKFLLKRYVFNEIKFQDIYALAIRLGKERYNRCEGNMASEDIINILLKGKDTFDIHAFTLNEESRDMLYGILSSIFPVSFAIVYVSETIFVLHPWTWRYFVLCDPKCSFAYSYESNDVIEYLYRNYGGSHIKIQHYSY